MSTTNRTATKPTLSMFYARNALSYLRIAAYWAKNKIWDKAIAALKAAIRSADRAGLPEVSGEAFVAIRACQESERLDAPAALRGAASAAGRQ